MFLGIDWVCWPTPRRWPPFIASFLGGNWPPGTQTIPVAAGNMETRVGGKPKPPWTGTIYDAREAGHAISVPSPLEAERHYWQRTKEGDLGWATKRTPNTRRAMHLVHGPIQMNRNGSFGSLVWIGPLEISESLVD
jgi:hypothetical protein